MNVARTRVRHEALVPLWVFCSQVFIVSMFVDLIDAMEPCKGNISRYVPRNIDAMPCHTVCSRKDKQPEANSALLQPYELDDRSV